MKKKSSKSVGRSSTGKYPGQTDLHRDIATGAGAQQSQDTAAGPKVRVPRYHKDLSNKTNR